MCREVKNWPPYLTNVVPHNGTLLTEYSLVLILRMVFGFYFRLIWYQTFVCNLLLSNCQPNVFFICFQMIIQRIVSMESTPEKETTNASISI